MDLRRIVGRLLLAVPLLVAGLALGAPRPAAAAFACTTFVIGGTITESVVVPAGATCNLSGVTVRGGITAEPGASLDVQEAEIRGSIVATQPVDFFVQDSTVRGNVTATGAPSVAGTEVTVAFSEVRGDVVLTDNRSGVVQLIGTVVRDSVTFSGNTGIPNIVTANTIEGDLDCVGNSPAPIGGVPNTVEGQATGQCAGLVAP